MRRVAKEVGDGRVYTVVDDARRAALELAIGEGFAELVAHLPFTTDREDIRVGRRGDGCLYIDAPCFQHSGMLLYAEDFWRKHGRQGELEQPESFWLALETELAVWYRQAQARRAHCDVLRCPRCEGSGLVTPDGKPASMEEP